MIDLRKKGLPSHIYVAGEPYLLDTDFRKWIDIGEKLDNPKTKIEDIAYVIKGITVLDLFRHRDEILKGIVDFYTNPNSTPRGTSSGNEIPQSTTIISSSYSNTVIFFPISCNPPNGIILMFDFLNIL